MGHTIETRKRAYDKIKKRKKDWFDENGPCVKCGSSIRLELDHIDPKTKESHGVWSWSEERRNKELVKCQVLCHECHLKKSIIYSIEINTGSRKPKPRTPSDKIVHEMMLLVDSGKSLRFIADRYGYYRSTVMRNVRKFRARFP